MYKICPKCGHELPAADYSSAQDCPACGLVFTKWLKSLVAEYTEPEAAQIKQQAPPRSERILQFFLPPHRYIGRVDFTLYAIIFIVLLFWGAHFISLDFRTNEIGESFLHNVNLVFHEAGHFLFRPAGRFMTILGGSLFQVLVPLFLVGAFLWVNKDGFGAAAALWWTGQSLMDLSPYIADARALRLPLLGGGTGRDRPGTHDWANLLRDLGWLNYDTGIATGVHIFGSGLMIVSFVWGAIMLRIYYRNLVSAHRLRQ